MIGVKREGMKIQDAKVIVTCPGRNFVTLKILTDQGVYGIGDATLNGRELAVVSYLQDHVVPALIGKDPRRIEDLWQFLYRGAYWRRGPVTMRAVAASLSPMPVLRRIEALRRQSEAERFEFLLGSHWKSSV